MELLHAHCAGLDVHKKTVVACVRHVLDGAITQQVRTFATTTRALLELADWLTAEDCTIVAMEATGIYWRPVWHVLNDGGLQLVLANAAHVKNVPGRKTDVNDATWLADLVAHGLIRGSFVPIPEMAELRTLTRTRRQLVRERTGHIQRIQKTLEDCNIKLAAVISDIMGKTGCDIIRAIIAGETDPAALAGLAHRRIRATPQTLTDALTGRVTRHHRVMLTLHMTQIQRIDAAVLTLDHEIAGAVEPCRAAITQLTSIPGVSDISAREILAEIGPDMSRFANHDHLVSWAGLCPRSDESAGKKKSTRLRKGSNWLKTTMVQCAWAAIKKKGSYLRAQFHRLRSHRGAKKAICAVAASMLVAIWHMLSDGTCYQDPGAHSYDRKVKEATANRLRRRLINLGYQVTLEPIEAA